MVNKSKVLLVAQEISLSKILASNDKRTRERGVKKLGKWLSARARSRFEFTEDDMMRVWKGLFYCMWMSDKPLVQEELAENISMLVHAVDDVRFVVTFVGCFLRTMSREWIGIDHFRMDKFLMLIRRVVRQTLVFCRKSNWSLHVLEALGNMLGETVLSSWPARSLTMHVCELFHVELAKVSKGRIPPDTTHQFLKPFVVYLANEKDQLLRSHVVEHIFHHLIRQSEFGQDCEAKFEAWKSAGFPGTSWVQMHQVVESDDDDDDNGPIQEEDCDEELSDGETVSDPRAGSVHVELKPLLFDPATVAAMLLEQRANTFEVQNRKTLKELAGDFTKMSNNKYPLKLTKFGRMNKYIRDVRKTFRRKRHVQKVTKKLLEFETKLMQQKGGKNKKSKKKVKTAGSKKGANK